MSIKVIIEKIKNLPNCTLLPPTGIPNIENEFELPVDLREFYELCGGINLFRNSNYQVNIVSPQEFVLANPIIIGERYSEDISSD